MKDLTLKQLAWLLPLMYLVHLAEEYFLDLAGWMSSLGADLSTSEFIWINVVGFGVILIFAILYSLDLGSNFVMWIFNSVFFVNGIVHILLSIGTFTYSPGAISGLIIYIPLGWYIYKRLKNELPDRLRFTGTVMGIMILGMVAMISFNI